MFTFCKSMEMDAGADCIDLILLFAAAVCELSAGKIG